MYDFVFCAVSDETILNFFEAIGKLIAYCIQYFTNIWSELTTFISYVLQPLYYPISIFMSLKLPSFLGFMVIFVIVIGIVKLLLSRGSFSE